MKKIILSLIASLIFISSYAQSVPQGMKYQAVARDISGEVIADKQIDLRVKLQSNINTPVVHYIEVHSVTTNQFGLFSLVIGEGEVEKGYFDRIPWSTSDIWMEIAIDDKVGSGFTTISNSKLLAVPYAFHAATANELVNNNATPGGNPNAGVPAQVWTLFGNSKTNSNIDKLGTTDLVDLVLITNNIERLRITKDGDINISNSLNVGHNVDIGNDLHVGNDAVIDNNVEMNVTGGSTTNFGDFTVENMSSTHLTGTLTVDGETDLNNKLRVNNGSTTELSGTLTVDGATELNNTLEVDGASNFNSTVEIDGATNLNSTLEVDGATDLNSSLDVDGATNLNNTLDVDGITNINNTFNVNNASTTNLSGSLNVTGASNLNNTLNVTGATTLGNNLSVAGTTTLTGIATLNNKLNANGQVTINSNQAGGDGNYNAYPLRVEGSAQGIAIKVTAGTPNGNNNFITFFDNNSTARGRIEGETSGEVATSPEYIFETAILTAEIVAAGVNIGLSLLPNGCAGVGVVACPPEPSVVAIAIAEEILAVANMAAYQAFAFANVGVTYESGSADYAEWLERLDVSERVAPGDIVGVIGGKITKNTNDVNQYLVVSTKPAVLGNMPEEGKEELFEKIAFMGQIPVKVRGTVNVGDYIIPSGLNDGTGIAVSSDRITPEQYSEIVGIAWTAAPQGSRITLVNMAIGLNTNDVARLVATQQKQIEKLQNDFRSLEERLVALETGKKVPSGNDVITAPAADKMVVADVQSIPNQLNVSLIEDAILLLEDSYKARGYDVDNHPGLKKLFNDQAFRQEIIELVQKNYEIDSQNIQQMNNRN